MTTRAAIDGFFEEKKFAVIGASRSGGKMGNAVLKDLADRYTMYPIHPETDSVMGVKSYRSFEELPERVDAAYIAVAPGKSAAAVRQAHEAGVKRIWIQRGAQSDEAIRYCEENGLDAVTKECIFMFSEPVQSVHKVHRVFKRIFGGLPK